MLSGTGRKFQWPPQTKMGIFFTPSDFLPTPTYIFLVTPQTVFPANFTPLGQFFTPILPTNFTPLRQFFPPILPPSDSFFHSFYPPRTVYFDNFTPRTFFPTILLPSDSFYNTPLYFSPPPITICSFLPLHQNKDFPPPPQSATPPHQNSAFPPPPSPPTPPQKMPIFPPPPPPGIFWWNSPYL